MPEQKKLTKRTVDALQADPGGRDVTYFDGELRGFGVRVKPSGAKSYLLKYRNRFGQQRKFHIARVGDIKPDQARETAIKLRGRIANGADPALDRNTDRKAMTVAELCDAYLDAERDRIKSSTLYVDRSRIERHVKPLLGSRSVASLTSADMEKFLRDVIAGKSVKSAVKPATGKKVVKPRGGVAKGGRGVASRTLGMLGTILERAVRDKVLAENPVRGVKRPRDGEAKPPFSFEAVSDLGKALRTASKAAAESDASSVGLGAIRFLLLSGCRRQETLTLQWRTVDRANRCLRFKDTKTGAQIRPIGRGALSLLAELASKDAKPSDYVFPGSSKAGHFVGLPRVWSRVCKAAGIDGVTIHGLRHWFASAATAMGYSELVIAGLLGHSVKGVTARYATAPDTALLAAADRVSQKLADILDGAKPDNVVKLNA